MRRNAVRCVVCLLVWKCIALYLYLRFLPAISRSRQQRETREDASTADIAYSSAETNPIKQHLLIVDWNNAMRDFGNTMYGACAEWDAICGYSHDRSRVAEADAVLFDLATLDWSDIPDRKNRVQKQLYVMCTQMNAEKIQYRQEANKFFNWTLTLLFESTFYWPVARYQFAQAYDPPSISATVAEKTKFLAVVFDDCKQYEKAERYMLELRKYVEIDFYGHETCANSSILRIPTNLSSDDFDAMILRSYRFFFALEQSVCKDYVTNNTWR